MSRPRQWLCIALFASLGGCADDLTATDAAASRDDSGAAQRDASASGSSDAAATSDAASSADAGGSGGTDAGGSSADAGGAGSSDAGGASRDAATALDAGKDGGASQDAGGSADAAAPSGKISCDPRAVLCDVVEPTCPENQVPSVQGSCYGPCVVIDKCSCSDAPECPQPETYTCHRSARHCGPFVN